ncbi:MAG: gdh, partial [Acidimicrobiia bacterium]|nr:gdh [Acidimicrobiia bacterium]
MSSPEFESPAERVIAAARQLFIPEDAALVARLAPAYLAHGARTEPGDPGAVAASVLQHGRLGAERAAAMAKVSVDGESLWIVTDDMPFLIESLVMAVNRQGAAVLGLTHPILSVRRDPSGQLLDVDAAPSKVGAGLREAWIHLELSSSLDPAQCASEVLRTLNAVGATVRDWSAMRDRALELADDRGRSIGGSRAEAQAFLEWLAQDHFTFLAAGPLVADGEGEWRPQPDGGLGLATVLADPPPRFTRRVLEVSRTRRRSMVHRSERMLVVDVHEMDSTGQTTRIHRFTGLLGPAARRQSLLEIPVARSKALEVLDRGGFPADSFSGRHLRSILESYPRDELLMAPVAEIARTALGVLELTERRGVRVFVRIDRAAGTVSAQTYLPRERYTTGLDVRIAAALGTALGATSTEHTTLLDEGPLARVDVRADAGDLLEVDEEALSNLVEALVVTWPERVRAVLAGAPREQLAAINRWAPSLPAAYQELTPPDVAAQDLTTVAELGQEQLAARFRAGTDEIRLRLVYRGPARTLTELIPLFGGLGVRVIDQQPLDLTIDGQPIVVDEFGIEPISPSAGLTDPADQARFIAALDALWHGRIEADGLNQLVLSAGLDAPQVVILRAYAQYLRQSALPFSRSYIDDALTGNPALARMFIERFENRFDPDVDRGDRSEQEAATNQYRAALTEALAGVASLDQDRILRAVSAAIAATTRTSWYQSDARTLAIKLDPSTLLELPEPRPFAEIWVSSRRVEGVHIRFGPVARGGIRWSDRPEDFRTEVLELAKTQTVKNAVIIPTGAKGGFVVKQPGDSAPECYDLFIDSLLSLTDNLVDGQLVSPDRTVCYDGSDSYLVVAADKGTASFSDRANALSQARNYWLDDAFASGGSSGYDHKVMAITARGAWESVRRHARSMELDADTAELTVVGIGDMSGDVFGNGLLRSSHLKLLAGFDHRHVFLDPDPDPAASFLERQRLFDLPRSSWADYRADLISAGGGVWPRTAKTMTVSPEAAAALAIAPGEVAPNEVIRAILRAPVDLLWNGGIGTYVKATEERNADAGDRANDGVRVDGAELRCRMVAEGGNLGFTQRARVEYALAGGLINTDAIDNSAGVDCSDHEVNIKIALRTAALPRPERDELIVAMTEDVAALVLADNRAQTLALTIGRDAAPGTVDVHSRLLRHLEAEGSLRRAGEGFPTDKQLAERSANGVGLTTPEMAVLLAHSKTSDITEVLNSSLPDEPRLRRWLHEYFPAALRERFPEAIDAHPLRREIVATAVVNQMVNRAGVSFEFRMLEQTGASVAEIVRAHVTSGELFELDRHWRAIDELGTTVSRATQFELFLSLRSVVERSVVWFLEHHRGAADLDQSARLFLVGVRDLLGRFPTLLNRDAREAMEARAGALAAAGVPQSLATVAALWPLAHGALDLVDIANRCGTSLPQVAATYYQLDDLLSLGWLRQELAALPTV